MGIDLPLIWAGIIVFILMYTAWSYYVFRGKVKSGDGHH